MRGHPTRSINVRIDSIVLYLGLCASTAADHHQPKLCRFLGSRLDSSDPSFIDNGNTIAEAPKLFELRRYHDNGYSVFPVVAADGIENQFFAPTSMPLVGSDTKSSFGFTAKAFARQTFC